MILKSIRTRCLGKQVDSNGDLPLDIDRSSGADILLATPFRNGESKPEGP